MDLYYYMFGNYYCILLIAVQYGELFSVIDLNPYSTNLKFLNHIIVGSTVTFIVQHFRK